MAPAARTARWQPWLAFLAAAGTQVWAQAAPLPDGASGARPLALRASELDPLADVSPLRPEEEDRYRLVQFEDRITPATHRDLAQRALDVVDYLPSGALIVRVPRGRGVDAALATLEGLRSVRAIAPSIKLEPGLAAALREGGFLERPVLDVGLYPGEDPLPVVSALEARFRTARIEFVKTSEPARITLAVAPAEGADLASALARDPAVRYIASQPRLELHNDHAVWIGQAFDTSNGPLEATATDPKPYPLSATIWGRGLRGEGQVLAVADTQLDHELCYFADPVRPVTVQNVAAPGPLALDPAHRKLLAVNAPLAIALQFDDWFRHGTHVTASALADDFGNPAGGATAGHDHGDGMAPAAKLVFEDISSGQSSSCSTHINVPSLQDLFMQEFLAGARVSSNSWGSTPTSLSSTPVAAAGDRDAVGLEADATVFSLEELLVVVSAGNNGAAGAGSISGFARCKNCVTVGATETWNSAWADALGPMHPDHMPYFSSRGPTADGRLKPDVTAPGERVESVRFPVEYHSPGDPACVGGDPDLCFPSFGGCYEIDTSPVCDATELATGTSQATPIVSGFALLARQYFTEGFHPTGIASPSDSLDPTAALLKAVLINGARNMTGHLHRRPSPTTDYGQLADAPSNVQGWGRLVLEDVLPFPGDARRLRLFDLRHASGIATGASVTETFEVTASGEPLKITLVWSDTPGTPIAFDALVNDLDLTLTAPDGTLYRGNQWTPDVAEVAGDMESLADPSGRDDVNNVEGILLHAPAPGLYEVEVYGEDVPGGGGIATQGAALVITGAVAECTQALPPAAFHVAGFFNGHVVLAWDPVPGALGYEVRRNETGCGDPMPADAVTAVPGTATSFADAGVAASIPYRYTVRARMSAEGCLTADSTCASVTPPAPGPPPVPDGILGSPMRVVAHDPSASELQLTWDVTSCPANDYHVLYGALESVALLEPEGAACDLGSTGTASWTGVPPGNVWFLLVSDDGAVTEGSWGVDSAGVPRRAGAISGECALNRRNDFGACD